MSKAYIFPVSSRNQSDLDELESKKQVYWYTDKQVSFNEGDTILIYVSGELRKIKYICEVVGVYEKGKEFELRLVNVIDDETASLLDYKNLENNGAKNRIQGRLILNNNPQLCSYISKVLLDNGYINKPLCDETKN